MHVKSGACKLRWLRYTSTERDQNAPECKAIEHVSVRGARTSHIGHHVWHACMWLVVRSRCLRWLGRSTCRMYQVGGCARYQTAGAQRAGGIIMVHCSPHGCLVTAGRSVGRVSPMLTEQREDKQVEHQQSQPQLFNRYTRTLHKCHCRKDPNPPNTAVATTLAATLTGVADKDKHDTMHAACFPHLTQPQLRRAAS
jgi:hypothetical protein